MFESLSARLQGVVDRLRGKAKIAEADLDVALREIRLALLEADVNFRVVKEFVARVRERALGADLLTGLNPGQQVVKIVHDELVSTLGGERRQLALAGRPSVLMLVGLQGSGKTTTVAKLGVRLRKEGSDRCWSPPTSIGPRLSTSSSSWVTRSGSRCIRARWAPRHSKSRDLGWKPPDSATRIWSSSTRPVAFTWTTP